MTGKVNVDNMGPILDGDNDINAKKQGRQEAGKGPNFWRLLQGRCSWAEDDDKAWHSNPSSSSTGCEALILRGLCLKMLNLDVGDRTSGSLGDAGGWARVSPTKGPSWAHEHSQGRKLTILRTVLLLSTAISHLLSHILQLPSLYPAWDVPAILFIPSWFVVEGLSIFQVLLKFWVWLGSRSWAEIVLEK